MSLSTDSLTELPNTTYNFDFERTPRDLRFSGGSNALEGESRKVSDGDQLVKTVSIDQIDQTVFLNEMPTIVDNLISGTSKDDVLLGDSLSNGINGEDGDDLLIGLSSLDVLSGDRGNDLIIAGSGDDRLLGGSGNDFLLGGKGSDNLIGSQGRDFLQGNEERDFLRGGEGKDFLVGDGESDIFILQPGQGTDTIADFEDGSDLLGLFPNLDFNQLQISQIGENTAITKGNQVFALLSGIDVNTIEADDFTLVEIVV